MTSRECPEWPLGVQHRSTTPDVSPEEPCHDHDARTGFSQGARATPGPFCLCPAIFPAATPPRPGRTRPVLPLAAAGFLLADRLRRCRGRWQCRGHRDRSLQPELETSAGASFPSLSLDLWPVEHCSLCLRHPRGAEDPACAPRCHLGL